MRQLAVCVIVGAATLVAAVSAWAQAPGPRPGNLVEVIVELHDPPAARGPQSRAASPRRVSAAQRRLETRLVAAVPNATVRWRYRLVLNGLAVVIPAGAMATVADLPGVASVQASVGYGPLLNASPTLIGAPTLWAQDIGAGGRGIKIGVIDDGIDRRSPLFDAAGFEMPDGFPRGDTRFTSAKVIVARAFPPPNAPIKAARLPFDRKRSGHGTHVAGIAAGIAGVVPPKIGDRPLLPLSGVAPLAYLGNYRAMTIPTVSGVGLNGNSPEIVAAIEAAVADGMDVINLSLGQPEVAPERDLVARALDNAAALGVIPVVAAGNEYLELGLGSVASPGTAARAITVGAVSNPRVFGIGARVLNTASPTLRSIGLYPLPGTGATGLTGAVFAATASPGDASYCTKVPPAPQQITVIGSVAVASGDGCPLVRKARNAAASGASALLVSSSQTDLFRARPKGPPIPIFVAPAAVAAELSSAIALEQEPLALEITGTPRTVLTGFSARVASFSASGPTPLGLGLKPDVVAPGVNILSSFPVRDGGFGLLSGTSMATPHVSGAAALLRELHPDWTVAQLKSALVLTGRPVDVRASEEAPPTRAGSGLVDLPSAAAPRIFSLPTGISFGLVRPGDVAAERLVDLTDAGGGAGEWLARVKGADGGSGVSVSVPAIVVVPGALTVQMSVTRTAELGERSGFIVLSQGDAERRVPFWLRVAQSALEVTGSRAIRRTGTYRGTTSDGPNRVDRYRYPERPWAAAFRGPEQTFRLKIDRAVANVGVAIIKRGAGVGVEPRIVVNGNENMLAGSGSLPFVANPYQITLGGKTLSAAVLRPAPGNYTVVFDSRSPDDAGPFQFRFWIDDTAPPSVRLVSRRSRNGVLRVTVRDRGSGVDPRSISYRIDRSGSTPAEWDRRRRQALVDTTGLKPGRHRLVIRAADRQEAKNTENTGPILPNTREITTTFTVPRAERG